ncbi:MAG: hypothetical protein JWQ97_1848 [Phenylobacterium sp.]|nr:hypothetical protein [Phenylobacterium sp.]
MFSKSLMLRSACAIGALSVCATGRALAQPVDNSSVLEEVVVTARKRDENLQNIPVAVTAQTGEQLIKQSIDQPSDLGRIVPSLIVPQSTNAVPNVAQFRLRGQTAPDNILTLSQPVGLYIDSVNVPHPVGANSAFFDLARVEVLKGPQGTLYGRNTTGGAINIVTRGADFSGLHGYLSGELTNYRGRRFAGAVNVPILHDMLAVRLAYQRWDRRGYGVSRFTGKHTGGDRADDTARLSVNFQPTSNFKVIGKVDYGKSNRDGNLLTIAHLNPLPTQGIVAEAAAYEGSLAAGLARLQSCVGGDIFSTCSKSDTFDNVKVWHDVLDATWDITDQVRLRSITGYHYFRRLAWFDIDGTPYQGGESSAGIGGFQPDVGVARPPVGARLPDGTLAPTGPYTFPFHIRPDQEAAQYTQEFNLSGAAFDGRFNWLVGAFASKESGNGVQISLRNPATQVVTAPFYAPNPNAFEGLHVRSRTWALFTQNDIKISDVVSVTLGARYTEEKLSQVNASWRYSQNYEHAGTPLAGPGQNYECLYGALGAAAVPDQYGPVRLADYQTDFRACALGQSAKFSGISYLASLNLQLTPDMLLYFKTSKGFRGGALQLRAPQVAAVRPETALDYEIGFKSDLLQHRLRANFAAYQTNYDNAQFSFVEVVPPGIRTTVLRNAAKVQMRGAEAELRFIPITGLTLGANVSYLDAHYVSFPGAPTSQGPVNAAGQRLEMPPWNFDINGRYELETGPGRLGIQADYNFASRIPFSLLGQENSVPDDIERRLRNSVSLVNARIDYTVPDMGLTVALFATNLLNKKYAQNSHPTGLGLSEASNGGVLTALVREPRIWGVSVRKRFGSE